ncbi:unnamed protein product [Sphagnum jensenii]|uniref:Uncharacterized protein n=1 Tax=Sphagnum jensenii TaxID=128206 RepID=A0ABP0VEJ6_9BRYO
MGWERKRGKLHEFNRLLRGAKDTGFESVEAPDTFLSSIQLVITLDSDTQLPRDAARKMIGASLHPLNVPEFDAQLGRVTDGYGILQPRIGISLESSQKSHFSRIFSGFTGMDPYTTAVSDTYQDIFSEANYTGKGLYHVDAFEAALHQRIPENTLLSHDLFEGLFSRTGLMTDIELLDDFPDNYQDYCAREHRWVRGDWQIARWIFPQVKNAHQEKYKNQLTFVSRWKIFDNLRRSLVAPTLLFGFVCAWFVFPGSPLLWSLALVFLLITPILARGFLKLLVHAFEAISAYKNSTFKSIPAPTHAQLEFVQALLYVIFLPHQALLQCDAICRSVYRCAFSKKHLLEWKTLAQHPNGSGYKAQNFWQAPFVTELGLLGSAAILLASDKTQKPIGILFILIWISYPYVAYFLSKPAKTDIAPVDDESKAFFRTIGRRTWNYFETFIPDQSNGLPPDNYQESPKPVIAYRTSPTNMGLYLLAISSANDLGYISAATFINKIQKVLATLEKLDKFRGHFYNWYNTENLEVLTPRYISTVDSGNLAGYLVTARQACLDLPYTALRDSKISLGILDTLNVVEDEVIKFYSGKLPQAVKDSITHARDAHRDLTDLTKTYFGGTELKALSDSLGQLKATLENPAFKDLLSCISADQRHLMDILQTISIVLPWLPWSSKGEETIESLPGDSKVILKAIHPQTHYKELLPLLNEAKESLKSHDESHPLLASLESSIRYVAQFLKDAQELAAKLQLEFENMDFEFLLDAERKVFCIGYDVDQKRFDGGFYDLLASESRMASFIAIAKGNIPQEHWFRLGRQIVPTNSGPALVSWTASMFEYLMPSLLMRSYKNTLLNETYHSVVKRQIEYGNQHKIPWGVSEAGYNARDLQLNYQYGPFGVPGLGLKRGLSHDLVVSPYSTLLAAFIDPLAAITNLKRLIKIGTLSIFGFYESIDYTPDRLPGKEKLAIIRSHMTHHQGMLFVAINNLVHQNIMQDRFHADPRVQATRLLLQERIPQRVAIEAPKAAEVELEVENRLIGQQLVRVYEDPNTTTPRIQLLSNREYSLMITSAGGGYSKCGEFGVTRWSEDATRDCLGSFIFVRNISASYRWCTTYQPWGELPKNYKVTFSEEKVDFYREDKDITTNTEIIVTPEDNVEIRFVTLTNNSSQEALLELTSYLEPVLGNAVADSDHPAFSKLFIQTEYLQSRNTLIAHRRKRSNNDPEIWGLHGVVTDGNPDGAVKYETDRSHFIGRGRTLRNAQALMDLADLRSQNGNSMDSILSLRVRVSVPPHGKRSVAFTTGLAKSKKKLSILPTVIMISTPLSGRANELGSNHKLI